MKTIEEAAEGLRKTAEDLEDAGKRFAAEGQEYEAAALLDWSSVVRDQLSLFTFITGEFVAGKVADRFVAKLAEIGGESPAAKAESLLRLAMQSGAFAVPAFIVHKMVESKGESWWAFLACDETYSLAVSEISSADAVEKAKAYLASQGWRPEMGEEIGILLCKQYERGRLEDLEEREKPIARPIKPGSIPINLNDSIRVKLKPWARDEVVSRWHEMGLPERYCRIVEDAEGVSKWTLWDFMHHFGKYMIMGRPESVKSMNVQIVRNT